MKTLKVFSRKLRRKAAKRKKTLIRRKKCPSRNIQKNRARLSLRKSDKESDEEQEAVITIEKTDESEPSKSEESGEKGDTEGFVLPAIVSEKEAQENGYVARDKDSEENLYTFVFRNSDGTGTMRLYSHPVKYIDNSPENLQQDVILIQIIMFRHQIL